MILMDAYKYLSKLLNLNDFFNYVKSSFLWRTRVNVVGIQVPMLHLIAIAIIFVIRYFMDVSKKDKVKVRAPYKMCGCVQGGKWGYASEVSPSVCPSGYICRYHNDVHWTDPECIPRGMEHADTDTCTDSEKNKRE